MRDVIEWLGPAAHTLVKLLEGPKFTRQLQRDAMNPEGIGGPEAVRNARNLLLKLGLAETFHGEETPRPRLYLRLTDKGRAIAEHLKAIQDLLDQTP